jgi:ATP-dependent Lhr-like helicase
MRSFWYISGVDSLFHPVVLEWFRSKFTAPTEAQAAGWPAIASGRHTLISAPTGSGKTLAAFLICIDRLLQAGIRGELSDLAQVVYVSPLKALSNDVHKNLSVPLQEITELARQKGIPVPEIRIAVRTGDTPAYERQSTARKPPHIWITTPESLYILLTSQSGRRGLAGVHTLILDEIHAIVDDKRGSHLALSAERLCALAGRPVTRIGLSATQRPIEEVARFLVGTSNIETGGAPRCTIIDTGHRRHMDLQIEMPGQELGPIATHELWNETLERVASLTQAHRTTLVFVNTRRLVERVAHLLSGKIGEEQVVAHHGSLSRKIRLAAEERLKKAEVKVCVATASLELGIDIGAVELVCQIGSPRSISILLQRVGRSGHWVGGVPKGRLFPLTRDELLECAALLHAIRRDDLEHLSIPSWPLDILSQQIVAMCGVEEWNQAALYRLVRQAYPYRDLPQESFDSIVEMLSRGIATRLGRRSAWLHYDRTHGILRGRRGARLAALTSGGAIPDNADYDVIVDPEGTFVGRVNEDFVVESAAGDVFLLGNTAWRVRRVEKGKLRVEDAHGQAPLIPFWLGEAPARTAELSLALSDLREAISERLNDREGCLRWLMEEACLPASGAEQAWSYLAEGKRVLGAIPTQRRIIAERFFDESGGMQLVLHTPFGGRINRAWGLALRKRFCRAFDFELQAAATDDGINLSLGPQHSFPLEDIFQFLHSRGARDALEQAVLASPIFTTRWRWTLTRSLALLRFWGGKRIPPQIQRMRSDDLLAAIFPAQAGCQDNRDGPDVLIPDHPLVFEALRDCLSEALDVEGLKLVLEKLEGGRIELLAKDTPFPSVFSHQILNAMPYAFLDDAPLEERRARAVILRRALPEQAGELGQLDPEAIRSAAGDAWPSVRDREELHDLLIGLVLFPEAEAARLPAAAAEWFESLVEDHRAFRAQAHDRQYWAAEENVAFVSGMVITSSTSRTPDGTVEPPSGSRRPAAADNDDTSERELILAVVRGWVEVSGPLTAAGLAETLGFDAADVRAALIHLEGEGLVLRGSFTAAAAGEEFCDRRILARIHRATIAHLRREIEPVPAGVLLKFLLSWQHLSSGARLEGETGVLEVIEQLQGFEAAAGAWEAELLPARVQDYEPSLLDSLCLAGEVVWGRWTRRETQADVPTRRQGITRTAALGLGMREDLPWLLDSNPADEAALSVPARDVLGFLRTRGASFFPEIMSGTRHLPYEVEDALWQLVAAGLVTADAFAALRSLARGDAKRTDHPIRRRRQQRLVREGRWSLLETVGEGPGNVMELRARQLLRRYGVLCRELLAREPSAPAWRELLPILRRTEARGEIRGGRFIAGLVGEQFALPEGVDALRAARRDESHGQFVRISACDPLNLAGIITPGARVPSILGNRLICRDGVPVAAVESGECRIIAAVEADERQLLERMLDERPLSAFDATGVSSRNRTNR